MTVAARYVRAVDSINYRIGRGMMYGIFAMIAVLLWSSVSKTFLNPSLWTLEVAQFFMVAYYIMGGPYAMQLGSNVRMDLFYSNWSPMRKAQVDVITILFLLFYLGILLHGSLNSLAYSLGHFKGDTYEFFIGLVTGQHTIGRLEISATAWRPYLWPVKSVLTLGIFLMLLQAISELLKDIATLRGGKL